MKNSLKALIAASFVSCMLIGCESTQHRDHNACGTEACCGTCGGEEKGDCCGTCGGDDKGSCCGSCGGEAKEECCGTCGGDGGHAHEHGDDHSHAKKACASGCTKSCCA